MPHKITVTIPEILAGSRLDNALSILIDDNFSRARLQKLIMSGECVRDKQVIIKPSIKVKEEEEYSITIPPAIEAEPKAQDIPLDIIYEDEDIIVLNKPVGLVVHPAVGHADGTLVNALLAHCAGELSGIGGVKRPGIVHRLDKDTSGLMVVAKNDFAHKHLSEQLSSRTLTRKYQAIIWKVLSPMSGVIEGNIGRSSSNRKKMAVLRNGGKEAITEYETEQIISQGVASLVKCKLRTGRTHQIRVHLSNMGHWLVGDTLYRPNSFKTLRRGKPEIFDILHKFPRQALHAEGLSLIHPRSEEELSWTAPLPDDFKELLLSCGVNINMKKG